MNYGIMFSEELQKQGARAVPTVDVMKELIKRKDYSALRAGMYEGWSSNVGKQRNLPFSFREKSIDPLEYKQQLLNGSRLTPKSELSREYYDRMRRLKDSDYAPNYVASLRPNSQLGGAGDDLWVASWGVEGGQSLVDNAAKMVAKNNKKIFPWTRSPYPQKFLDTLKADLADETYKLNELVNNGKWV